MFSANGLEGEYRKSNPLCITKLYAVKENGEWRLKYALSVITEKWTKKIGKLTVIYLTQYALIQDLATRDSVFFNQIAKEFQFPEWKPFKYYMNESGDEPGKLINFDFFFPGYTK